MEAHKTYELDLNNRAFDAIRRGDKRVEIRVKVEGDRFDYGDLRPGDLIQFTSLAGETMTCRVLKVCHYPTVEELLSEEGTKYTLSSTDDFEEGVKSIHSFPGYTQGIEKYGVWAIHIAPLPR